MATALSASTAPLLRGCQVDKLAVLRLPMVTVGLKPLGVNGAELDGGDRVVESPLQDLKQAFHALSRLDGVELVYLLHVLLLVIAVTAEHERANILA